MMMKKYIPVTFSKDEINYFTLAIVLKIIDDANVPENVFFYREYFLGTELFIEETYFLNTIVKIKNALSDNSFNSEFRPFVTDLLTVLKNTVESGVKSVGLADNFKVNLTPYYFKTLK